MKRGLVVASFGTTYEAAREDAIGGIERAIAAATGLPVARAFTSGMVRRSLAKQGVQVDTVMEAIAALRAQACEDIGIVPTHVVAGIEYEKVLAQSEGLPCAKPLLYDVADYMRVAEILGNMAAKDPGAMLFMGHGTEHAANESYERLRSLLAPGVYLACVEGELSLEGLLPVLDALPDRRITLAPFMIVAGDHAHNDLAGEEEDSWKAMLQARGMTVSVRLQGLGEMPEIQQIFVQKAKALWA